MYLLGIDLGSSSVKASVVDADTGRVAGSGQHPPTEMTIDAPRPGFAEQDPAAWWDAARKAVRAALVGAGLAGDGAGVGAIGIAYQMHGLVCLDDRQNVLRPSIIWCDSRAVEIGREAFDALGHERCLSSLLNAPGNFTASKLRWVARHDPATFARVAKFCLPGDWLAAKLTGKVTTTISGLSEGMLWDFASSRPADFLLEHYGIAPSQVADLVPTFGPQGELTRDAAQALGLEVGTPVTYRAGDQPNNAMSLGVLNAGEVAATAGTSGVVYGVAGRVQYDPQSRINTFAHVTHTPDRPRLGLLLCINGTGIANAWTRRLLGDNLDYPALNALAQQAPVGSDGLLMLPFGNGAERVLGNANVGAHLLRADFNRHARAHVARATQEGIAMSFHHGMDILRDTGVDANAPGGGIRAGHANLFLSPLFRQTLATLADVTIELYDTDGSVGAARGAGIGVGAYTSPAEAFTTLKRVGVCEPRAEDRGALRDAYARWSEALRGFMRD